MMRNDSLCEQRGKKRKLKKEKGEEQRGRTRLQGEIEETRGF